MGLEDHDPELFWYPEPLTLQFWDVYSEPVDQFLRCASWLREAVESIGLDVEDGSGMTPERLYKEYKAFLKRAKVRDIRFHDLRHSCASLLFAQGCSRCLLMEILGHSQISLTANLYTRLLPEADREAANAMQAALGSEK